MSARVVLLGGAPGVGKSTVAQALARHVASVIEVDALWGMHGRADYSDGEQFMRALRMAAALVPLMPSPIVVVSPWAREAVNAFVPMLACGAQLVSLVASAHVLTHRMSLRASWAFHDVAAALTLNEEHWTAGHYRVDTTGRWAEDAAADVLRIVKEWV